ncbi:amino acid permease [Myroides injenensis]|uniref:amino acid permease n=1 Tax=Myroides injenensis TaxID=1183151 RepID=UPI000289F5EC|nr:amino acid permease [Myroides injenensis]
MGVEGFTLLLFGFLAAIIGVSLPGLLNMTAVKVATKDGYVNAFKYTMGAIVVIFIQTYIAIFFARLIDSSPAITEALHEIGLVIFGGLTLYFLVFAKRKEQKNKDLPKKQTAPFLYGALLASINVFSIPYYVFLGVTLFSYGYGIYDKVNTSIFSIGVVVGSALMFYLYILFFKRISNENAFIFRNINYVIGSITGIICLITIYKLLK